MTIVFRAVFHEGNVKMLYYDRTGVSEGTDVDKASKSKECDICHY